MQGNSYDEIELEHMRNDFFVEEAPDEIGFEDEFEDSGEDSNSSEGTETVNNFANHMDIDKFNKSV